eukprot:2716396-Amphidinium_carterae.1
MGVCHCGQAGVTLRVLHQRVRKFFDTLVANENQSENPFQKRLQAGTIVLQWHSTVAEPSSVTKSSAGADGTGHYWFHVALHYVRPWRPTF